MAVDADIRREKRILTILDIMVIAFLGLTGAGLICLGGFGWLIIKGLAHTHGGNAGAAKFLFLAMSMGGVALLVAAVRRVFTKDVTEQP